MKLTSTIVLFLFAILSGFAQEVFINPSSVTLTNQGPVTVIVTGQLTAACEYGNTGRTTPPVHVTIGTVQTTYSFAIGTSMSELGVVSGIISSSAGTGILDAGTYTVASDSTVPIQITVILWNESGDTQGSSLSDIELTYSSATAADQAAFQAFIASLVQQQLDGLQSQIDSQQNQIVVLQQSDSQQSSDIATLQQQVANLQSAHDQMADELTTLQAHVQSLETQVTGLSTSNGTSSKKSDNTLTYVGLGLGAAGFIGGVVNFFTQDVGNDTPSPTATPTLEEGSEK